MNTVRLSNSTLAVFSPTALTPAVRSAVASLNAPVTYLIAPDIEHHIFLSDWYKAFPNAHVVGPEGLPEKRASSSSVTDIPFTSVFKAPTNGSTDNSQSHTPLASDAAFNADFKYEYVHSHVNKELVFLYKPDRTMIQADLLFNLPPTEQYSRVPENERKMSFLDRVGGALLSTQGPAVWQKRFLWYMASAKDRAAFNQSVHRINEWDFQRIIPCHGDVVDVDAKGIFRKVFEWHLVGAKGGKSTA
jgi:hypothetical protein